MFRLCIPRRQTVRRNALLKVHGLFLQALESVFVCIATMSYHYLSNTWRVDPTMLASSGHMTRVKQHEVTLAVAQEMQRLDGARMKSPLLRSHRSPWYRKPRSPCLCTGFWTVVPPPATRHGRAHRRVQRRMCTAHVVDVVPAHTQVRMSEAPRMLRPEKAHHPTHWDTIEEPVGGMAATCGRTRQPA